MMKTILALVLTCLLLTGCAPGPSQLPETIPEAETAAGRYTPDSAIELETGGEVRAFPLHIDAILGFVPVGEDLLVFSDSDGATVLTLFRSDVLAPAASYVLDFGLSPKDVTLRISDTMISFFDRAQDQTLMLNPDLTVHRTVLLPDQTIGEPVASLDGKFLYYCTADALRVLDLDSGISRCLKEIHYDQQYISGLFLEDRILQLEILDSANTPRSLFLSTENGQVLYEDFGNVHLRSSASHYYATVQNGQYETYVFGVPGNQPYTLDIPHQDCSVFFLENSHAVVSLYSTLDSVEFRYYDLSSGQCSAVLSYSSEYFPWNVCADSRGRIWFLNFDLASGCNSLYCWEPVQSTSPQGAVYTALHYTAQNPDYEGLAQCSIEATRIGEKHGIEVLVYHDAAAVEPWDYDLEPEHQVPVLRRELALLDQRLNNYPRALLQKLREHFSSIRICIVRSLKGSAESGSLDSAVGIQFYQEMDAYLVLAAGCDNEYTLYHELCHMIDSVVLSETTAYSRWEDLNPTDFSYDYDYIANQSRDGSLYLQESTRAFVDTYSMSFPKEDRARVMEYAMMPGNRYLFQSPVMQQKLQMLCQGIREAFNLEDYPQSFLWEQYLQ